MSDVVDVGRWHQIISEVKELADKNGAEFELKKLENGKEYVLLRQFYRPRKGDQNVKSEITRS